MPLPLSATLAPALSLTLVMTLTLGLAACQTTPQIPPFPTPPPPTAARDAVPPPPIAAAGDALLTSGTWQWVSTLMSDGAKLVPDAPERYTLKFDAGGRVEVRADCNRGSASYLLDGNALAFGPIALTRVACPPGSRDADFLRGLTSATQHLYDNGDLVLTLRYDSGSMRFRATGR